MRIETGGVRRYRYHEDGMMGPKFHGIHGIHTSTAVNLLRWDGGQHE